MASTPETSNYTSIADRSKAARQPNASLSHSQPRQLLPFVGYPRKEIPTGLPFRLSDYLELVDWSGRAIVENKRGYILVEHPPILKRLQIEPESCLYLSQHFESRVGTAHALKEACRRLGYRRTPNLAACERLLL